MKYPKIKKIKKLHHKKTIKVLFLCLEFKITSHKFQDLKLKRKSQFKLILSFLEFHVWISQFDKSNGVY